MADDNYTSVAMPQPVYTSVTNSPPVYSLVTVQSEGVKLFDAVYPESILNTYGFVSVQSWSAGVYMVKTTTYPTAFVSNAFTIGFH